MHANTEPTMREVATGILSRSRQHTSLTVDYARSLLQALAEVESLQRLVVKRGEAAGDN